MPKPLPPAKEYFIAFNTTPAGYLKGVKVTIEEEVVELDESVRVDLADHPLYRHLQSYIRSNPR
ncbi:hypothetical protein [Hydrocarboniphaga effusa]|uniref:hypothetical protein n=1 Tax=Hydrocarboniphaga effusa TaxID=243629 RepID=UPI003BA8731E